jgi:hypothetical protein
VAAWVVTRISLAAQCERGSSLGEQFVLLVFFYQLDDIGDVPRPVSDPAAIDLSVGY